jgi:hypothetical protein
MHIVKNKILLMNREKKRKPRNCLTLRLKASSSPTGLPSARHNLQKITLVLLHAIFLHELFPLITSLLDLTCEQVLLVFEQNLENSGLKISMVQLNFSLS